MPKKTGAAAKPAFRKFPKIRNSYDAVYVSAAGVCAPPGTKWHAREKIDGQNTGWILWRDDDGEMQITCSRRNGLVMPGENFSNHEVVRDSLEGAFAKVFGRLAHGDPDIQQVTIFGELYGGFWMEKTRAKPAESEAGGKAESEAEGKAESEVKKEKKAKKTTQKWDGFERAKTRVQTILGRVAYTPDRGFAAFKVLTQKRDGSQTWLNESAANELLTEAGVPIVSILATGTLREMLALDVEFPSTIGTALHGLPTLDGNAAEGIVITPETPVFVGGKLVAIKKKAKAFSEKAAKSTTQKTSACDAAKQQGVDIEKLHEYVAISRVHSVRGNMSEREASKIGCVIQAVVRDVIQDYCLEVAPLTSKQRKAVGKALGPRVVSLVRQVIMAEDVM